MAEKKIDEAGATPVVPAQKGSRSLFAPLAMILIGVLFLLDNLNVLPPLNWGAALRFWPLALIFLGLNVLVVQFRRPLGTVLSLLVTAVTLATFGYLLLSDAPEADLRGLGLPVSDAAELREETFALSAEGITSAEVTLHLGNFPTSIGPLNDGGLIAGSVWTRGAVQMEPERDGDGHLELEVGVRENPGDWFDPRTWQAGEARRWTIDLSPTVPLDLHIDAGNGATTAALDELNLTALTIDSGNGALEATLPDGEYEIGVDSGNGSVRLQLPQGVEARVEYDTGNGSLNVDGRFERVSGDRDEGVYETPGYEAAGGLAIRLDSGNGSVTITTP
ncbi:MAG: hypothetical protein IPH95_00875 [Candidatus Promineofilum sp.]|jgi:hypothetical protein|nr:hypothetical protein [Promineifilum sp.]